MIASLPAHCARPACIRDWRAARSNSVRRSGGKFARIVISAAHYLAEHDLVFQPRIEGAQKRNLQTSDDEIREPVAASDAISISRFVVIRVDRDDAPDPLRNRGRHGESQCIPDRFAYERDVGEVELLDENE